MSQFTSTENCLLACGIRKDAKSNTFLFTERTLEKYAAKKHSPPNIKYLTSHLYEYLPKPLPDEWLSVNHEKGQTFKQFLCDIKKNVPNLNAKIICHQINIGNKRVTDQIANGLVEIISLLFNMSIEIGETLVLNEDNYKKFIRNADYGKQFQVSKIFSILHSKRNNTNEYLIGLTMNDIYDADWKDNSFVFGCGDFETKSCVCSLARYEPPFVDAEKREEWRLKRVFALVCHEIGHMFGLEHCIYYKCLMNGANSMDEEEKTPLFFCPVCLQKLNYLFNFKLEERLVKLIDFFRKYDLKEELKWHLDFLKSTES